MSKKDSNKTLGIVFVVLLVIVGVIYFTGTGKHERNFRKDIVDIDTSAVSEIFLYPKSLNGKYLKFFRTEKGWMINYDSNKVDDVPAQKINNLFAEILKIKPLRVAARSKSKWNEYQVTDKSTRIKVVEDGDTTLNLIIGKFSYKPQKQQNYFYGRQQPQMNTYVRLGDENEVYEVNGFLSLTFNQGPNAWRNGRIIKGNYEKWNRLSFDYPADSSFQLVKVDKKWQLNGKPTDSVATVRQLRLFSSIFNENFVDDISPDSLKTPDYKLTIEGEKDTITVKGFKLGKKFVISSSQNPGTYFDGNKGKLKERIFVSQSKFFKSKKKKKK